MTQWLALRMFHREPILTPQLSGYRLAARAIEIMAKNQNETRAPAPTKVSVAQACRDVIITAINKGQLPFVIVGAVVVILAWKVPPEEVTPLVKWVFEKLSTWSLLGYSLFVVTVFLWYFHAQRVRRELSKELEALRLALKEQRRKK